MPGTILLDEFGRVVWVSAYNPGVRPDQVLERRPWDSADTPGDADREREAFANAWLTGRRQRIVVSHDGVLYVGEYDRVWPERVGVAIVWRRHAPTILSDRERAVLAMILDDTKPKSAIERLGMSMSTYETHRRSILDKTQCKGNATLALWARDHGLA